MEVVHSSKVRPPLPQGPFLVVGLARSGVAAAMALKAHGQTVSGVDSGSPQGLEELDSAGIGYELESDGLNLLDGAGTVVKSPGVPAAAPVIAEARGRGITVIGEMELGWLLVEARYLAVTGTNGKTTTTELAAHIFRTAGRPVAAAGNVGNPLSALSIGGVETGTTVVCECSSFQLEDTVSFSPEVAVHLNLAPDHLDRHGDFDSYAEAKLAIFRNQTEGDIAVLNAGDPELARLDPPGDAAVVRFHAAEGENGSELTLRDGVIRVDGKALLDVSELQILGNHNVANAMAAAAGALSLGLPAESVASGLRSFGGVAHRLEPIAEIAGVRYINDSKATNVEATRTALGSFESGVRLILGGSLKGESFEPLLPMVRERCRSVYLIGEAAGELREALEPALEDGVVIEDSGDLPSALAAASAAAAAGDTVLLSPACASFGEFRDYEDRGDRFRQLVGELDAHS
ncbi:MAG TPA: UDP-N-acetylmuramoyl-L-alanine--D-glutamate ligase [Solirubrobacterales bacterium]|nr:UDP-N-acetylmuramoyl-L-alanine--D-glutamate ligase [Solirubrobacterales bacterium]